MCMSKVIDDLCFAISLKHLTSCMFLDNNKKYLLNQLIRFHNHWPSDYRANDYIWKNFTWKKSRTSLLNWSETSVCAELQFEKLS